VLEFDDYFKRILMVFPRDGFGGPEGCLFDLFAWWMGSETTEKKLLNPRTV
jgi:hypothetical protein